MDQYSTYKNNKIMMSQITQINLLGLLMLQSASVYSCYLFLMCSFINIKLPLCKLTNFHNNKLTSIYSFKSAFTDMSIGPLACFSASYA
jgi:hypothetical protein